jgi:hypothetical protein
MEKDIKNCPFCEEKEKKYGGWTFSQDEWKDMKEKHEKEHILIMKGLS